MPLKIKFGLKKRNGKSTSGDSSNAASNSSTPAQERKVPPSPTAGPSLSRTQSGATASEPPLGYTAKDVKKLPKLHRAIWKDKYEKVHEIMVSRKYDPSEIDKAGRSVMVEQSEVY